LCKDISISKLDFRGLQVPNLEPKIWAHAHCAPNAVGSLGSWASCAWPIQAHGHHEPCCYSFSKNTSPHLAPRICQKIAKKKKKKKNRSPKLSKKLTKEISFIKFKLPPLGKNEKSILFLAFLHFLVFWNKCLSFA
jgi:hypothetical protein